MWVNYCNVYNLIVVGCVEVDLLVGVYKCLWEDLGIYVLNGEWMVFYIQWVYYWVDLKNDLLQGWDIWILFYLYQCQVDKFDWDVNKVVFGYGIYVQCLGNSGDVSSMDGNDNLLFGLFWLIQCDQWLIFVLWGICILVVVQVQVVVYGFVEQLVFFYVNNWINEYSMVKFLDMSQGLLVWLFL